MRVIRVLEQLIERRTKPQVIRVDNGPEFISDRLQQWCDDKHAVHTARETYAEWICRT